MLGTDGQPGVIPRTLQYLLNRLREEDLANDGASSVLGMSYLEVYNEKIVDLLDGSNQDIKIQTAKNGELNLLGLKKYGVEKFDEFKRIFITANEKRSVSSTQLNNESSRSHSVLTLYLNCKRVDSNGSLINYFSKINLIDLAGSEDNRRTGNQAGSSTFKESTKINLSLTVLKRVVKALTEEKSNQIIPYRDSKLTRILCDCLGGNARSLMFLAVAPEINSVRDTASSLSFSNSAKKVKNEPVQNIKTEDMPGTPVKKLIKDDYHTSPLILTPIRNVRKLERFMDDLKQESRHQLKVEKTKMIRRKLTEQAREEEEESNDIENKENYHSTMIAVEEKNVNPVNEIKNYLDSEKKAPAVPVKLNDRDAFAVKLNDYTIDQLKKLKKFPKNKIETFLDSRPLKGYNDLIDVFGMKKAGAIFLENFD